MMIHQKLSDFFDKKKTKWNEFFLYEIVKNKYFWLTVNKCKVKTGCWRREITMTQAKYKCSKCSNFLKNYFVFKFCKNFFRIVYVVKSFLQL